MALLTGQIRMRARQRKVTEAVIEACIVPISGVMTGPAIRAILSIVLIILLVAGVTIGGRTFELLVDMTRLTCYLGMFALELEGRKVVIECRRLPTIRSVTLTAVKAKAALVRLIVKVTGIAILQSHGEIA